MPYVPDRRRSRSSIRVSDDERERAAVALRGHFEAGRLSDGELEERVAAAYRASTRGELAAVFGDLPRIASRRAAAHRFARFQRGALRYHAALYATLNGALVTTWALTGGGEFWPAWSLVPGTALLGWHGYGVHALHRALRSGPQRRSLGA